MKIIQPRRTVESVTYTLHFEFADMPGSGFTFDCDEHGNVDRAKMNPCALKNMDDALTGSINRRVDVQWRGRNGDYEPIPGTGRDAQVRVINRGVQEYHRSYREPAIGECSCGEHVALDGFTNTCHGCGADYNTSGQRLAPRSQWGEETGESVEDILGVDGADTERLFD